MCLFAWAWSFPSHKPNCSCSRNPRCCRNIRYCQCCLVKTFSYGIFDLFVVILLFLSWFLLAVLILETCRRHLNEVNRSRNASSQTTRKTERQNMGKSWRISSKSVSFKHLKHFAIDALRKQETSWCHIHSNGCIRQKGSPGFFGFHAGALVVPWGLSTPWWLTASSITSIKKCLVSCWLVYNLIIFLFVFLDDVILIEIMTKTRIIRPSL